MAFTAHLCHILLFTSHIDQAQGTRCSREMTLHSHKMIRSSCVSLATLILILIVGSAGLPPVSPATSGSRTGDRPEPDTDLSLGRSNDRGVADFRPAEPQAGPSSSSGQAINWWPDRRPSHEPDLNLNLATDERQRELANEALMEKVRQLRSDLHSHSIANGVEWPVLYMRQGYFERIMPAIKQRALGAFRL